MLVGTVFRLRIISPIQDGALEALLLTEMICLGCSLSGIAVLPPAAIAILISASKEKKKCGTMSLANTHIFKLSGFRQDDCQLVSETLSPGSLIPWKFSPHLPVVFYSASILFFYSVYNYMHLPCSYFAFEFLSCQKKRKKNYSVKLLEVFLLRGGVVCTWWGTEVCYSFHVVSFRIIIRGFLFSFLQISGRGRKRSLGPLLIPKISPPFFL